MQRSLQVATQAQITVRPGKTLVSETCIYMNHHQIRSKLTEIKTKLVSRDLGKINTYKTGMVPHIKPPTNIPEPTCVVNREHYISLVFETKT